MKQFLQKMPKIELHAHLNGSLSITSIRKLGETLYGTNTEEFLALTRQFINFDETSTLNDCFKKFNFVHELTAAPKGLELATQMVIRDFAKENVIYLELRTTPKANKHMTRREYIECVLMAIEQAQAAYPNINVKLLPSIDRSQPVEAAEETIDLALEYQKQKPTLIAGIDLSGNPHTGNFNDFKEVLSKARNAGLNLTLHCAEIDNKPEIQEMIEFGMMRCGHGTFLSDKQIETLRAQSVAIECCLTSNVKSATVASYDDHHLKRIMQAKCPTVLCTDDSGVFDTTLTQEFQIAATTFGLSHDQCVEMTRNAVDHIFATDLEKLVLKRRIDEFRKQNVC